MRLYLFKKKVKVFFLYTYPCIKVRAKVRDIFLIDIFSQLFEQFQSIYSHFKEHLKVHV
jgi:hypothetical protein